MFVFKLVRFVIHLVAVLLLTTALILIAIAVCTPYWRYAFLDKISEDRFVGLWQFCLQVNSQKVVGELVCSYKTFEPTKEEIAHMDVDEAKMVTDKMNSQEYLEPWELVTLVLVLMSLSLGVFGLMLGLISLVVDYCKFKKAFVGLTIAWSVLTFVGLILIAAAVVLYLRTSFDTENRFVFQLTARQELKMGYSFKQCVTGTVLYAIAFLLSATSAIVVCIFAGRERHEYNQVPIRPKRSETTL